MNGATQHSQADEDSFNITEIWLRKDPARWIAGAFAGILALLVMFAVTAIASKSAGHDLWILPKAFAVPFLGGMAMENGIHMQAIATGFVVFGLMSLLLGVVFAHMTGTNRIAPLIGMGLTWGAFSWIFINNLFSASFREVFALGISKGNAFFAWMAFGLSLVSVSVFDRIFRGSNR